jgi:hypothetical protein
MSIPLVLILPPVAYGEIESSSLAAALSGLLMDMCGDIPSVIEWLMRGERAGTGGNGR